jgi:hydrogenase maturation factor
MAFHELATAAQVGIVVEGQRIPILQEAALLCQAYGLDPLGTIASGALLIATSAEQAPRIQQALQANAIACAAIGRIVPSDEGVRINDGSGLQPVPKFSRDEITKVFTT